jgi:acetolactate synthase regulatory subunit
MRVRAVFILELHASDVHAVLGRLLDQTRVAGLRLAEVSAQAEADKYRIQASIDVGDREIIDRLARRVGAIVGVVTIQVSGKHQHAVPPSFACAP